ncbi:hypothetical protein [Marinigracilibium pacificum]|uniref:Uncharacterized protein n=1 Tax=Marinigracilibium pacificum TaxID=2729599 RepID=A0A848IYN0_9BACT|nr:hypothetical protein [Marinigracilibium pacificum]NMM47344.1 hypothetical protein [Marinigracilibium pacificum]
MRAYNIFIITVFFSINISAQESNLEKYTPSILFSKGQWELNTFFNIYTQNSIRDKNGDKIELSSRQTYLNGLLQYTLGVSNNARINVGMDFMFNRSFYDSRSGNPLKVIYSGDGDYQRTVLSAIGPRIRFVPIKEINNLSIQSTFLFPVAKNQEAPLFTAHDRYTWFTQIFFDQRLNNKWRLFLEGDVLYRIKRYSDQTNFVRFPVSAFINYFPSSKASLYTNIQYSPRFENISNEFDEQFGFTSWFTQVGIGGKYQLTSKLGAELSYGNFINSRGDGAGYTINFGLRYIH